MWFTIENMHVIVNKGGLANILKEEISRCFQGCHDDAFFYKNRHNKVRHYIFRYECKTKPSPLIGKEIIKNMRKNIFQHQRHCHRQNIPTSVQKTQKR